MENGRGRLTVLVDGECFVLYFGGLLDQFIENTFFCQTDLNSFVDGLSIIPLNTSCQLAADGHAYRLTCSIFHL